MARVKAAQHRRQAARPLGSGLEARQARSYSRLGRDRAKQNRFTRNMHCSATQAERGLPCEMSTSLESVSELGECALMGFCETPRAEEAKTAELMERKPCNVKR